MAGNPKPKVVLFDIGGVCTLSPFQAILDYEREHGIPPGWVNHAISRSAPNGAWHRLERGEIPLDAGFFAAFSRDLYDAQRWRAFHTALRSRRPGPDAGSDTNSDHEAPPQPLSSPPPPRIDAEDLFNKMMLASRNPDPWIFPALQTLKASGQFIVMALSNTIIFPKGHPLSSSFSSSSSEDGMPVIARNFDVFVSSAHVGLRKPDPAIYQLALRLADDFARRHAGRDRGRRLGWEQGVVAGDVVFLDDIGENLKAARKEGFRTIKVPLGRAYEAVDELESVTGLRLAGGHPRVALGSSSSDAQRGITKARI